MKKVMQKARRKKSIRKKISGTPEKPRMCIHKSLKNITVQVIDDISGKTVCGISSLSPALKDRFKAVTRKNINVATALGEEIAKAAMDKGIKEVVFDRSGYKYHGAVKALADAARKQGLQF